MKIKKIFFIIMIFLASCVPQQTDIHNGIPTKTPTTFTPTPEKDTLSTRTPSLEQITEYLQKFEVEPYNMQLTFGDVNGDGEKDLIASNGHSASVMLWEKSNYSEPYLFTEIPPRYGQDTRITLQDWTNDGTPEILFDFHGTTGGTGEQHDYWTRQIIHCEKDCRVVWQGATGAVTTVSFPKLFLDFFSNEPTPLASGKEALIIQTSHAFSLLWSDGYYLSGYLPEPIFNKDCQILMECRRQNVFTARTVLYRWNGSTFEKIYEEEVDWPHDFPEFNRIARNTKPIGANGFYTAKISEVPYEYVFPKKCQLEINDKPEGELFYCFPEYVNVEWTDVTGDEKQDIVIKALVSFPVRDDELAADKGCFHERVFVYQWDGKRAAKVADITGCVVREDLFGVRLEDIDEDGIPEIIAADELLTKPATATYPPEWTELSNIDQVYKWDGTMFSFLKTAAR